MFGLTFDEMVMLAPMVVAVVVVVLAVLADALN